MGKKIVTVVVGLGAVLLLSNCSPQSDSSSNIVEDVYNNAQTLYTKYELQKKFESDEKVESFDVFAKELSKSYENA